MTHAEVGRKLGFECLDFLAQNEAAALKNPGDSGIDRCTMQGE